MKFLSKNLDERLKSHKKEVYGSKVYKGSMVG